MEALDQGVTPQEGVDAPIDAAEESPTTEQQGGEQNEEQQASSGEEELPFGKHPRWLQKLEAERKYRAQIKQYEERLKGYEPIHQFDQYLAANPHKAEQIRKILEAKEEATQAAGNGEDPYAGFSPEVADRFRKLDALEQWKSQFEQTEQQRAQEAIATHQSTIDESYRELLIKDGFLNAEGKPVNQEQTYAVDTITKSFLDKLAQDPQRPSVKEMKEAYSMTQKVFKSFGTKALQKAVKQPGVPPSGSKSGAAYSPKGNKPYTLDEMAAML